ncbi:unnamed protein product [Caenorhabditis angaria]|uniref:Gamma interferon inducible lysosomal thiol reductase n=1 Tax=Caenorhabditis angaria TaxID=860376 RepID=A0A9P1IJ63_9PELO|nr:unnamed protein product [Caenorhabditis angaria]
MKNEPLLPHIRPSTKNRIRKYLYIITFVLAIFLLYRSLSKSNDENIQKLGRISDTMSGEISTFEQIKPSETGNTVKIDLYVESLCPDTSRFFRQQLSKMWDLLGGSSRIQLTISPFGKARCVEENNDFKCQCQHGNLECEINQLQNCIIDRTGFPEKFVPAVLCMQGKHSLEEALKCVETVLPGETHRMRECASGQRGRRLLALAGQRTAALRPSIEFIPWIMINGERNSDALYDLTQNVCQAMEPKSPACKNYLKSLNLT